MTVSADCVENPRGQFEETTNVEQMEEGAQRITDIFGTKRRLVGIERLADTK